MEECKYCDGTGFVPAGRGILYVFFIECHLCHGECVTYCNDLFEFVDNRNGDTIRED